MTDRTPELPPRLAGKKSAGADSHVRRMWPVAVRDIAAKARWNYLLSLSLDPRTIAALDLALETGAITIDQVAGYVERGRGGQLDVTHWLFDDGRLSEDETTYREISARQHRAAMSLFDQYVDTIPPETEMVVVLNDGHARPVRVLGSVELEMRPPAEHMQAILGAAAAATVKQTCLENVSVRAIWSFTPNREDHRDMMISAERLGYLDQYLRTLEQDYDFGRDDAFELLLAEMGSTADRYHEARSWRPTRQDEDDRQDA